jgi:hypothetical protein
MVTHRLGENIYFIPIMRNKILTILTVCGVSCLLTLTACQEGDNDKEWGSALIYMPQASILNGGMTNEYPVPLDNNPATRNYTINEDSSKVSIVLGVYRSGMQELQAYKCKVYVDHDATQAALGSISRSVELPAELYTLPTEVSVANGAREAKFYLEVDYALLREKYPAYNRNKMVLVVGISDPDRYELNESLARTTVVINGSSFLEAPKIIKGGDFSDGSEQYWTRKSVEGNGSNEPELLTVANGLLTFDYGAGPITAGLAYYQPVSLTKGTAYQFSADFTCTGGASGGQFFMTISTREPSDGNYYGPDGGGDIFANIDVWASGGLTEAHSGKMTEIATWVGGGLTRDGTFTPGSDGQYYMIIICYCWGGTIGKITVDNVKIEEK